MLPLTHGLQAYHMRKLELFWSNRLTVEYQKERLERGGYLFCSDGLSSESVGRSGQYDYITVSHTTERE
jgi:hypothetical protein